MRYKIHDTAYHFDSFFDTENGFYMRTGLLDEKGRDTGIDPFMASFPHLIDVGVMGHCIHGENGLCRAAGVQCYQSGYHIRRPDMTVENFEKIVKECRHKTNQLALGGRGDPNQHKYFEKLLEICRENDLVPNYTTSGFDLTDEQVALTKAYCGAVAVSWYRSDYTLHTVRRFVEAGCRTNIHYVLSKNSLAEAIERLSGKGFVDGINAVIFLLHKPVGQGEKENMITMDNPLLEKFINLVNAPNVPYKIGFDSCSVPMIVNKCPGIAKMTIDTCEGARFSCYISSDMVMTPCSFDREERYGVSLQGKTIYEVWNSPLFEAFRDILRKSCPSCSDRAFCMGGCPLVPDLALCDHKEKIKE